MDKLEMARALLSRSGAADPGRTATAVGVAASDSAGGLVRIDLGGDTVSPDDDQSIECETTFKVYAGDEVLVSLIGADGSGKTPIVVGVVGRGDQVQEDLDAVKDVKNYFWQDERGAHVSTEPNSVAGANILLDSDSLDIRQGEDDSEPAQRVLARFGRNSAFIAGIDGTPYWQVRDLRTNADGTAAVTDVFYGDGTTKDYATDFSISSLVSVTKDGVVLTEDTDYTLDPDTSTLSFVSAPASGAVVEVAYLTEDGVFSFSQGQRDAGVHGPYSFATGKSGLAAGAYAEAHGYRSDASGQAAEAHGYKSVAAGNHQTVLGRLNVCDDVGDYSLIIGNGKDVKSKGSETFYTDGETLTVTLQIVPNSVDSVRFGATFSSDSSQASALAASHGLQISQGLVSVETPFDYDVTFLDNASPFPHFYTLNAGRLSVNTGSFTMTKFQIQVLSSAATYILSGDTLTLTGAMAYWAQELSGIPFTVNYSYGSTSRSDAMTLDWTGRAEFAGPVFAGGCTPNGTTPHQLTRYNSANHLPEIWNGSKWAAPAVSSGKLTNTANRDIELPAGSLCILFTYEFNASTDAYRGHHAYLLYVPREDLYGTTAIQQVTLGASTNSGVTITRPNTSILQLKCASATYYVEYRIVRVL